MSEYLINSEAEGIFWNTMKKEGVPSHHQEFDHDTYIAIIHSMEEYARMILERDHPKSVHRSRLGQKGQG